jgi:hypothetical protein
VGVFVIASNACCAVWAACWEAWSAFCAWAATAASGSFTASFAADFTAGLSRKNHKRARAASTASALGSHFGMIGSCTMLAFSVMAGAPSPSVTTVNGCVCAGPHMKRLRGLARTLANPAVPGSTVMSGGSSNFR